MDKQPGKDVLEEGIGTEERREGTDRRKHICDRRTGLDRRQQTAAVSSEWDRRRGPGRRRSDERRSAEEGEMNDEQFAFIQAIDEYKRANQRPFPTFTEILEIAKAMGYRKVADPVPLNQIGKEAEEEDDIFDED